MDLFLAHSLILLWASVLVARRLMARGSDRFLVAALLGWGNVVAVSLLLSFGHRLGERRWFFGLSTLLAALLCVLTARLQARPVSPPLRAEKNGAGPSPWLRAVFIAFIIPLGLASLAIACTYQPNGADSLTCNLPRALYYLGQNSLSPFRASDPRLTSLPFNYNLLQVFGLIYGPPLQVLNIFNLLAWVATGLALHRLCRLCACGAHIALAVTGLAMMAPPVIAQVGAAQTDLPAAAAFLSALVFALRWAESRRRRDAMLAGLAAGLAAGSSLSILYFLPSLVLLPLAASLQRHRLGENTRAIGRIRAWLMPALLALILSTPFLLLNPAARATGMNPGTEAVFDRPLVAATQNIGSELLTSFGGITVSAPPGEITAGFGPCALIFLLGAVVCLIRFGPLVNLAGWCAGLGLGAAAILLLLHPAGLRAGDFLPAFLVTAPCLAACLASLSANRRPWLSAACLLLAGTALTTAWSAGRYLLENPLRPLLPLIRATFTPPALPALPLLVEHRLSPQSRINVDTDGVNESILPFLVLGHQQRFTSVDGIITGSYNLLSRSYLSRGADFHRLARRSSYVLIPIPAKRTAGVEFLATVGRGSSARDYFGLEPQAGQMMPINSNRSLLLTISHLPAAAAGQPNTRLDLAGLNPEDQARLVVILENSDGSRTSLAALDSDGELTVLIDRPFHRLLFQMIDSATGAGLGLGAIYDQSPDAPPKPWTVDPSQPTRAGSLFVADLVLTPNPQAITVNGLLPVEGPFPQWELPFIRWARTPSTLITIPPMERFSHLSVSFSVRLHVRKMAALDVLFNGRLVQHLRIDDPTVWVEQTLELTPQPGPNQLEFRDGPLHPEPDWLGYLERYPDVKEYLVRQHTPLAEGAREHYETHGRSEGRTLPTILRPEPAPDGYYFMYRNIRLEGFSTP